MSQVKDDKAVILFERALQKVEKNMGALALLMEHFDKSGFDKSKYTPQFQDMMGKFAKLMREYTRTEYEYEGPYSAEQTQDRYKASVAKSWKHKPGKEQSPLTEEEIRKGARDIAERKEALAANRARQALLEGTKARPMITGPDGKQRYDFAADAESSDEDEADLINRVIGGDPNPGKHDSAKLRTAHLAKLKHDSMPVSRRLEHAGVPEKTRNTALVDMLRAGGSDQFQEYRVDELDDVHTMQKSFLTEIGSDEEEDASSSFGKRTSQARGSSAIKRTEDEMIRRQRLQAARDKKRNDS